MLSVSELDNFDSVQAPPAHWSIFYRLSGKYCSSEAEIVSTGGVNMRVIRYRSAIVSRITAAITIFSAA